MFYFEQVRFQFKKPESVCSNYGMVGVGWTNGGEAREGKDSLGRVATVWDGEVRGLRGALEAANEEQKILILSDSQAAIAAVKKAGR